MKFYTIRHTPPTHAADTIIRPAVGLWNRLPSRCETGPLALHGDTRFTHAADTPNPQGQRQRVGMHIALRVSAACFVPQGQRPCFDAVNGSRFQVAAIGHNLVSAFLRVSAACVGLRVSMLKMPHPIVNNYRLLFSFVFFFRRKFAENKRR